MTTDYEPNVVLSDTEYDTIGSRPIRPDGHDKVTGRAIYGIDYNQTGLLHGRILRSPHAHAHIKSLDASKALELPGVKAVVTGEDLPQDPERMVDLGLGPVRLQFIRENILAGDKALYKGHPIAAVAATSLHVADEAIALIEVEYETLPSVTTVQEAMEDDAPLLHESLRTSEGGEMGDTPTNVASHLQLAMGDIDQGFSEADVIVERTFNTKTVHQGYLEPHNSTALWNTDGRLSIWCSTQGAFAVRDSTALILDLPVSQIKVTPLEIGGGFGGKTVVYVDPVAALLSKKSGQPVKIVMTRQETFEGTGPTSGSNITIKMGAKNDGTMVSAHANMVYEAGAYPGSPVGMSSMCTFASYVIDNQLIDGYDVVVNKPKAEPYRAPGVTNLTFAVESVVDELASKLGIDTIDFRLQNAAKEGTSRADGAVYPRVGCVEVLEAMKNHPHYNTPLEGPNQGRGVALGFWFNIGFHSAATISVNADGTVNLVEGSTDIGGSRASISMQAAEVLGIPVEDVHPTVVDTDSVGYTMVTAGSRTTFATGWAAYEAAQDVNRQMIARAAQIWEVDAESLQMDHGVIKSSSDPELHMTFKDLAGQLAFTGENIVGSAAVNPMGAGGSFAGNIVDVEVDPETGKVEILRFTAVQDAGKAIHPSYVEGQMQGGSSQGIGWALNEEYFMSDDGEMQNVSLLDYRMPTSLDVPMIDTVIVEVANPGHPFGVRGVGEANIIPPAGALANAISNAVDVRMDRLPMNPGAIIETISDLK